MAPRIHSSNAPSWGTSNAQAETQADPANTTSWGSDAPGPLGGDEIECLLFDEFLTSRAQLHQKAKALAEGMKK